MFKFLVNAVLLQVACIQTVFGTFSPEETKTLLERLLNGKFALRNLYYI